MTKRGSGVLIALAVAGLLLAACQGRGAAVATPSATEVVEGRPIQIVTITAKDNYFDPGIFLVKPGTLTLTLTNAGNTRHEVAIAATNRCCLVEPVALEPGQSSTATRFSINPGTYEVFCQIHRDQGMTALLTTEEGLTKRQ